MMRTYTSLRPANLRGRQTEGKAASTLLTVCFSIFLCLVLYAALRIPQTNQAIRQIRREINDGRLRQEELQKTLLNTENKLEELMDGGRIARMATPLGLRHPPHDQRVIPMKVCRTKEGKVYPVMVGSRR